jgi:hypothetical protein
VYVIAAAGIVVSLIWVSLSVRSYRYRDLFLRRGGELERAEAWQYHVMSDIQKYRTRMPRVLGITGPWAAALSATAFVALYVSLAVVTTPAP